MFIVVAGKNYMKHIRDLTEQERSEFADKLGDDLTKFFEEARNKYQLCDACLHGAVMMMCENYVEDLEGAANGTKH